MPQAEETKLYRTFVKGLITEATPLTFPEDASYDEDNMVLLRAGNRRRRFGIDFEDGYVLVTLDGESAASPGDVLPTDPDPDTSDDPLNENPADFPLDPEDVQPV